MFVPEIRLVLLQRVRFNVSAEVIVLLRPFVTQLDDEKDDSADNRDSHVNLVAGELPHLQRRPRQHHRDR